MELAKLVGANIKRLRGTRNLTQAGLAEVVGVSIQTIWSYENGVHGPQLDTLTLLAKALKVQPWQLLAREGEGGAIPPEVVESVAAAARACGLRVNGRG